MKHQRLWYPPNSFGGSIHWEVQTLRVTGEWMTYTEHPSADSATAQLHRMMERYPTHQLRLVVVGA
jgi:hypothetical protein